MSFQIYGKSFNSRLILGTSRYPSLNILEQSIKQSGAEILTVSLRRQSPESHGGESFWNTIRSLNISILPNTAGCFTVKEAVATAKMAREFFQTNWIKLEVIGDEYTLLPHPLRTLEAAQELVQLGFQVFPYMTDDLSIAKELVQCGCEVLMPLAAPIGSGKGILQSTQIKLLREYFPKQTLIVDAGIGAPSHAAFAMELGCDAVLLNSAVALARDPVQMACAFSGAIFAGRQGYVSGMMPQIHFAQASTPMVGIPFSPG